MQDIAATVDPLSILWEFRRDLKVRCESFNGRTVYVVEDPLHGKFYQIGPSEFRFLRLLTGSVTLQEALAQFSVVESKTAFTRGEAELLIKWAAQRQLLQTRGGLNAQSLAGGETAASAKGNGFNPLYIRIPLGSPQRTIQKAALLLSPLFSWPALALFGLLWLITLVNVVPRAAEVLRIETLWHPQNWLGMFVIWLLLKAWHELGHGIACYRFGGRVRACGVALMCFAPVAYVDVTSAWRIPSKWQRIVVSLAGMYFEGWIAALALLVAAFTRDELLRTWACHVAFIAGGQTLLVNANPLIRFDGYYVLADWLELPNLHALAKQAAFRQVRIGLGDDPGVALPLVRKSATFLTLYFLAASAWRAVLMFTGCAFLIAQQQWLGKTLTYSLVALWLSTPLLAFRRDWESIRSWKVQRMRVGAVIFGSLLLLGSLGWWFVQPAVVRTDGIVDYVQLTTIRAPVAGFVEEVCVANNAKVQAGDVLVRLRNEDLEWKSVDLQRKIAREKAIVQSLSARFEIAKREQAQAMLRALETHQQEITQQIDSLTIRAPHAGRFVARDLDSLPGRYLVEGTQVAVLGADEQLHVLAVVPQHDWKAVCQRSHSAKVVLAADPYESLCSEKLRFDPAAKQSLPHDALAGTNGGPIAMRMADQSTDGAGACEPLACFFVAYVQLPTQQPREIRTGERASIYFSCVGYSRAAQTFDLLCRWFHAT